MVNLAVLVLRRDVVPRPHFRTPTALPVLGAVSSLALASPLADRPADVYVRAGALLALGIVLWLVNRYFLRRARGQRSSRAGS